MKTQTADRSAPRHPILAMLLLGIALVPIFGSAAIASEPASEPASAPAGEPDAIVGRWQTEDQDGNRDSIVEITRRGEIYVGRVVWMKYDVYPENDPRGWAGRPVVDRENPDPALRDRSLLGVEVLSGLRFDGEGWSGGAIYTPRKGQTYTARAWLEGAEKLKIRGYVGTPWLGRTVTWLRAPESDAGGSE